ncbi:hypothetical protein Fmac_013472 [Flemingia macrophylla]|uniref:Uncharacterized protein n=1 Tax=Flemingia macrophylla TaxID=520843 RepID=A0ABD1MT76_9FABA
MAVVTSTCKRRHHWLSANHHNPAPDLKRPRVSTMTQNHTPPVLSSRSVLARISRYPEVNSPLPRDVHAPCRPLKFAIRTSSTTEFGFNASGYSRKQETSNDVGKVLTRNYQRAKNSALGAIRFEEKGKEVIELDNDSPKGMVSEDSGVEVVRLVEEDAREVRSEATEHKWQEDDLVVTEKRI